MPYIGQISALTAALLWSLGSFVFTDLALKIGAIALNVSRLALATLLLIITILIFNVDYSFSSYQFFYLTLSGFVGLVLGDTFIFLAFKDVGPRISLLIMSANPALGAVLAYFYLDENLSLYGILGMIITLAGIAVVVTEKRKDENSRFKITAKGIIFSALSAVGQAVGLVLAKEAFQAEPIHSLTATAIRIGMATLMFAPATLLFKRFRNKYIIVATEKRVFSLVLLGSIIGPFLGITLSFIAILNTKIGVASTLMATVPIIMLPLSRLIHKEKISFRATAGAILSFLGISMLFLL